MTTKESFVTTTAGMDLESRTLCVTVTPANILTLFVNLAAAFAVAVTFVTTVNHLVSVSVVGNLTLCVRRNAALILKHWIKSPPLNVELINLNYKVC